MRLEHQKQNSHFQEFLTQVENMDLVYAQNQKAFAKKVQQLVNQNLTQITVQMKTMVSKNHDDYEVKANTYRENIAVTVYLFEKYKRLFEKIEEQESFGSMYDDCFLSEQRYIANVNKITTAIYELRTMLINVWNEALNMETQRIRGIQNLYEEIVKSNSNVYGEQAQKELIHMRDKFLSHPLFSVRGLLREKELEAIVTLCYQYHRKINIEQATPGEI